MKEKRKGSFEKAFYYIAAGTELAASVIGGAFIGMFLDSKFGGKGLFLSIFTFVGFVAGVYNMVRIITRTKNG